MCVFVLCCRIPYPLGLWRLTEIGEKNTSVHCISVALTFSCISALSVDSFLAFSYSLSLSVSPTQNEHYHTHAPTTRFLLVLALLEDAYRVPLPHLGTVSTFECRLFYKRGGDFLDEGIAFWMMIVVLKGDECGEL